MSGTAFSAASLQQTVATWHACIRNTGVLYLLALQYGRGCCQHSASPSAHRLPECATADQEAALTKFSVSVFLHQPESTSMSVWAAMCSAHEHQPQQLQQHTYRPHQCLASDDKWPLCAEK